MYSDYCGIGDDLADRVDEIEALASIFEDAMTVNESDNSVDFSIAASSSSSSSTVMLHATFPSFYPSQSPPQYELSAPFLSAAEKRFLRYGSRVGLSTALYSSQIMSS
jgi:hypothetical protein